MRKMLTAIILTIGVFALTACGNSGSSETVVETTAGNIEKDEFYEMLKERYGAEVLQEIVLEKILDKKYEVTDAEIERTIDEFREQIGEGLDAQYSKEELTRVAKFQILQEKAVTKDITVTDEELKEYYDEIKPEVHARHILVDDEKKAKDLKKELDNGADFEELAKENSTDPGSASNGGDLGWFGAGDMVAEFEEATYKLKENEISVPVKTTNGWHIIQLLEKKEKDSFDDLKAEIELAVKLGKVDAETIRESLQQELEDAKVNIKDKDLKDIFKSFEA